MLVLGILHYVSQWLVIDDFGSPLQPSLLIVCFSLGQIFRWSEGKTQFYMDNIIIVTSVCEKFVALKKA